MGVSTAEPYRAPSADKDGPVREALHEVWRPNMGYRMAWALVRNGFAPLNLKRVHRVCRELRLSRVKRHRKKRTGTRFRCAWRLRTRCGEWNSSTILALTGQS